MSQKMSLGQAIDQVVAALEPLDPNTRKTVITAVSAHLGLEPIAAPTQRQPPPLPENPLAAATEGAGGGRATRPQPKDIRSLKDTKQPSSAKQMACLVGYYLAEIVTPEEQKEAISSADIEKYFKQAGYPLPGKLSQILPDAKRSGYFDSQSRGLYKLNAVGYNLVAHKLPDDGAP